MIYDTIPSLDHGRPVLSNVRLTDFRDPRPCPGGPACDDPAGHFRMRRSVERDADGVIRFSQFQTDEVHPAAHPFYVPFLDYSQLVDWRDGDVLLDEVAGVASSRESGSMPFQVANLLQQLRRRNIAMRWTAPAWPRADKIIREVTQAVHLCVGWAPKRRPHVEGEAPSMWQDRRAFTVKTYDAALMDEFTLDDSVSLEADVTQRMWRPGALVNDAYDTNAPVASLGWASESGMCLGCGGKRPIPKCSCGVSPAFVALAAS
jgi:hypothetical protein